ncbi:enoyl-CoA hydratase/isomerase family protein [Halostella salina]|uniref:enoyl-CoA hydratase/isomerase family protein n=1 Tax=Halostella salina TaxID=1547897 RepID=UPI000EF83B1E|nr:enoyl-CoA hydratase/isomerase family protein [Halostella salina]
MIESTADGRITTVTLARPERRNALTPAGLDELRAAVTDAATPVVSLRGAGEAFCAGADLNVVDELDGDGAAALARRGQRTATAIAESDSVVVAGVDGAARGGGMELALACDLRVATPAATFAEPGVEFGLFGAWGGTVRLPRIVDEGEAMDLALSGRVVDAAEAREMGLVSRVVEEPLAVAEEVAGNDPAALAAVKERLRDDADTGTREEREVAAFADLASNRRSRKG